MQRTLQYINRDQQQEPAILQTSYLNVARDLSRLNSKNEEVTTRDGHVYGYLCRFKMITVGGTGISMYTAPNTWKMRNAFRKFHAYRDMMFDNAGIEGDEMGRYGKTIRPLLDTAHKSDGTNTLVPYTADSGALDPSSSEIYYDEGEWTYTQLATTPLNTDRTDELDPVTPKISWADAFNLKICELNEFDEAGDADFSGLYSKVGMIHSYNLDRMEVLTPDATTSEVLETPSNPLAALRATGNRATGEVLDIAVEQESELPPYDQADDGNSIWTPLVSLTSTPTTGGTVSWTAFLPAGLARIVFDTEDVQGVIEVEVLDKILCKDMA
jgi:hypothetical protein